MLTTPLLYTILGHTLNHTVVHPIVSLMRPLGGLLLAGLVGLLCGSYLPPWRSHIEPLRLLSTPLFPVWLLPASLKKPYWTTKALIHPSISCMAPLFSSLQPRHGHCYGDTAPPACILLHASSGQFNKNPAHRETQPTNHTPCVKHRPRLRNTPDPGVGTESGSF